MKLGHRKWFSFNVIYSKKPKQKYKKMIFEEKINEINTNLYFDLK